MKSSIKFLTAAIIATCLFSCSESAEIRPSVSKTNQPAGAPAANTNPRSDAADALPAIL